MFSAFETVRAGFATAYRPLCMAALWVLSMEAAASVPDSLSIKDKAQINKLAELTFGDYEGVLLSIAGSSAESESEASEVQELLKNVSEGEDRIFINANAIIQDNVDPDLKPGAVGLDRKVADYGNDLFLYFRGEGSDPVEMEVQGLAEPAIGQDNVYTKILYLATLKGHHKTKSVPYVPHRRVMTLVAVPKGAKDWSVFIASDDYYDEGKGFVPYQLEKDIKEASTSGAALTPEMLAYQESANRAEEAAAEEREERKKRFDGAMAQGSSSLAAGDFDDAEDWYKQAGLIDPLSLAPLVQIKATRKARLIKQQNDEKKFTELLDKGHVLRSMHEYARALDSYQHAAAIFPNDLRCKPMIDSLDAMVKAKADHERFIDAKDYQGSTAEAQRLLKMPGMQDDADLRVLYARSLRGAGKRQDAINVLNEVIKKNPFHAEALRTRADILRTGTAEERAKAIPDLMVLKNRDVWDVTSYHHYAMLLCFDLKRCKEAVDVLQEALKREPGNSRTLYLLGRVNSVDGFKEYTTALKDLREAISLDSTCGYCWLEQGIVLLELDSIRQAEQAMARAKSLGLEQQYADRADSMAARNYRQAIKLVEMQGRDNADRIFMRACVLDPDKPGYRLEKARNLMILKKYAEAIVDLDVHIERTPAPYAALLDRASCKVNTGRYAEARQDVAQILNNQVDTYAAMANLVAGQAAYYMDDLGPAEAHFKETLRLDKKNAKANRFMTLISIHSDRSGEAVSYGKKAVDLEPTAENYMNLGAALQADKDVNGSVDAFNEALRLGADRSEVEKRIGKSYLMGEKYKLALEHFAAQKLLKDDAEVPRMAAECHFQLEQYDEAIGELNQLMAAHREVENEVEFQARLAYLYVIKNDLSMAKGYLDKSIGLDKVNTLQNRQMLLAKVAYDWKNSDKPGAVSDLQKMVSRHIVTEKALKEMPVLKDIVSDKLWKDK